MRISQLIALFLPLGSLVKPAYAGPDVARGYTSAEIKADLEPGWHQANVMFVKDAQSCIHEKFMVPSCPDSSELVIEITIMATEEPTAGTLKVVALDSVAEDNGAPTYNFDFSDIHARKRQRDNVQVIGDMIMAYCDASLSTKPVPSCPTATPDHDTAMSTSIPEIPSECSTISFAASNVSTTVSCAAHVATPTADSGA
ncbi:hypothetical protein N7451_012110 [Penicillium sp. IBT 35674x]|nr:hypothetical protein N7451_012110 [Penicillium sp. IBT 35674x]